MAFAQSFLFHSRWRLRGIRRWWSAHRRSRRARRGRRRPLDVCADGGHARDPRWGRIVEGAGEDPYLGADVRRAGARLSGIGPVRSGPLLACVKHFAGYGAADGGRDYDSAHLSDAELYNVYLPPFKAAVDAGVGTVMSAYMNLNDVPATGNAFLLGQVLRKEWGFKGFVVSDANSVGDLVTASRRTRLMQRYVRSRPASIWRCLFRFRESEARTRTVSRSMLTNGV